MTTMHYDPLSPHVRPKTLADLLTAYAEEYLPSKAPTTQYQQRALYAWMCEDMGSIPLTELTPAFFRAWRDKLSTRYAPGTVRRYLACLSGPLRVAVQDYDWLPSHPLRKVHMPPESPARVRFLSEEELPRLLAACVISKNPHLYPIVLVALATGARKTQVMQLRWRDVKLDQGVIWLGASKSSRRRSLPLVGPAAALLRQRSPRHLPEEWVFARLDGKKPIHIDAAFKVACKRAELLDFHFHDLRHTCASYLAMAGASIRDIQEILGHSNITQSARYTHLTTEHVAKALERMTTQRFGDGGPTSPLPPTG